MKIYDIVKQILERNDNTRSSDKYLIWSVFRRLGYVSMTEDGDEYVKKEDFMECPSFESITRARRKVQENHPELQAVEEVRQKREQLSRGDPIKIFEELL
jgi:hypothetical protein